MSFFDDIKAGIQSHFDKRKEDREMMERLQKEAQVQQSLIFQEQFKKNALAVARARAMKDAASLSGLQKLRATNRARNLNTGNKEPGSFFGKLSEYTQKNMANRDENLKRTAEMRETGKKLREESLAKRKIGRW